MIVIYTKSHCDKCVDIKKKLTDGGVEYEEKSTSDRDVMQGLVAKLKEAGLKNPLLPVLEFDDGSIVSNDMGLYKELKQREIL
jgi:glutaredoxin